MTVYDIILLLLMCVSSANYFIYSSPVLPNVRLKVSPVDHKINVRGQKIINEVEKKKKVLQHKGVLISLTFVQSLLFCEILYN